jgi:sugar lactone lactonase YvrE
MASDGITIDAKGNAYVAHLCTGQVQVLNPKREVDVRGRQLRR